MDEFTSLIIVLPRAIEGRVCNLLRRVVAAEIVQHKLIKASTNIGHCHGLLRSYDLTSFQRFLAFCAGRTGQLLNYSSLSGDCGISQPTAKSWLGLLETSFLVFRLPALHTNLRKRLVKMPKLHFYDTGLACWLLGIYTPEQLQRHPLRGAIFESWVISEIVKQQANIVATNRLSFYRDQNGAEADLIIEHANGTHIVEAKSSATPGISLLDSARRVQKHLSVAMDSCKATVVYGGEQFQYRGNEMLIPWQTLHEVIWQEAGRQ